MEREASVMYIRDSHRDVGGVRVTMEHDEAGMLKPRYVAILKTSATIVPLNIDELRGLRALLNEHMAAFERHAEMYSHP